MLTGYAHILLFETGAEKQLDDLRGAGCEKIFQDESSSSATSLRRPALHKTLSALKVGDTLVVCSLDRLGHSLPDLVRLIRDLGARGIDLRSLRERLDTTSSRCYSLFEIADALTEFERALIARRTRAGQLAARRRGTRAGRKPKLTPDKIARAQRLIDHGESPSEVARSLEVSIATLYRHIPAAASNRTTFDLFAGSSV